MDGYIYKLTLIPEKDPNNIFYYYGSTIDHKRRLREHKKHYNNDLNKLVCPINVSMKVIEIIENCYTEKDEKLRKREQEYIDTYTCINTATAWTGTSKYIQSDKAKENQKKYRNDPKNKPKIDKYQSDYRNNPENKAKKKELQNLNKEKTKKRRQERVWCSYCFTEMSRGSLHRHQKDRCKCME